MRLLSSRGLSLGSRFLNEEVAHHLIRLSCLVCLSECCDTCRNAVSPRSLLLPYLLLDKRCAGQFVDCRQLTLINLF